MKTTSMLLSLACLAAPALVSAQAMQPHKLAWLHGCWAKVNQERAVEEQWMAPRGKTMICSSRTVQGGANLVSYEFMMIRQDGDHLAFEVRPSGWARIVFDASTLTDSSVVFETAKRRLPAEDRLSPRRRQRHVRLDRARAQRRDAPRRIRQVVCAGG